MALTPAPGSAADPDAGDDAAAAAGDQAAAAVEPRADRLRRDASSSRIRCSSATTRRRQRPDRVREPGDDAAPAAAGASDPLDAGDFAHAAMMPDAPESPLDADYDNLWTNDGADAPTAPSLAERAETAVAPTAPRATSRAVEQTLSRASHPARASDRADQRRPRRPDRAADRACSSSTSSTRPAISAAIWRRSPRRLGCPAAAVEAVLARLQQLRSAGHLRPQPRRVPGAAAARPRPARSGDADAARPSRPAGQARPRPADAAVRRRRRGPGRDGRRDQGARTRSRRSPSTTTPMVAGGARHPDAPRTRRRLADRAQPGHPAARAGQRAATSRKSAAGPPRQGRARVPHRAAARRRTGWCKSLHQRAHDDPQGGDARSCASRTGSSATACSICGR